MPRRVLLVRLGAIGDVVNALVVAARIRAAWPGTEVGWAVHRLAEPLVRGNPAVDRVHAWDRRDGVRGFLATAREARGVGYDLAVDLAWNLKSAALARLSGAPRVVGLARPRAKEGAWLFSNEKVACPDPWEHMVLQYERFSAHLGLADGPPRHPLPSAAAAPREEAWAAELVAGLGAAPVVVGVGASYATKRWPTERFLEVARGLARAGLPVVLTGGPGDRDAALAADLGPGVHDLVGRTTLPQLLALLRRAAAFVSGDTGPMHLAVAAGAPVVALFGPGEPRRTGPWDPAALAGGAARHRVVRVPPDCAPCNRRRCRETGARHHACMLRIDPDPVLSTILELLQRAGAGTP